MSIVGWIDTETFEPADQTETSVPLVITGWVGDDNLVHPAPEADNWRQVVLIDAEWYFIGECACI